MFVLLSAGFEEEDLGSCSHPPAGLNSLAGVPLPLQRGCWQRTHLHQYKHSLLDDFRSTSSSKVVLSFQELREQQCLSVLPYSIFLTRKRLNILSAKEENAADLPALSLLC